MWLLACSVGVLWVSVGFCPAWQLARFAPAPCMAFCGAFAPAVGICSEMQQYRARRVLWWLLGLWLRRGVALASDRLRLWDPRRGFCSSIRVTVSGILSGSRSVGASASAPGSVARSSADVLTAPAIRSGCPCMVDVVRGSFRLCSAGGGSMCFKL